MVAILATTDVPFLDLAANVPALAQKIADQLKPAFIQLGLELAQFNVENVSLPDELTKVLDQRIGMGMVGDVGRYTQYAAAESLDLAAANTGGGAGVGLSLIHILPWIVAVIVLILAFLVAVWTRQWLRGRARARLRMIED